jgi:UDP-glucose 4-epimerase
LKIFITGIAGFIGSNLAKRLLELGHTVIGIDNLSYGNRSNISALLPNKNFLFIQGDVCNPFVYNKIESDVIVHLASQKIPRYTNALRTLEENNIMLKNIVALCLHNKSRLIFSSTSDVYGKNLQTPINEESDLILGPTKVKRWAYATSKIHAEQYIIACNEECDLKYAIARFFGTYGPNQNLTWWGGPQSTFIQKAFANEPIEIHGDGSQTRTFTYIEDTVSALVHLIESEKSNGEIFNVGALPHEEISICDLASFIWKLVNGMESSPKLNFIPYETFGRYEDVMRRVPDINKLKEYFGFTPQYTLEEGLKLTIEWQKNLGSTLKA